MIDYSGEYVCCASRAGPTASAEHNIISASSTSQLHAALWTRNMWQSALQGCREKGCMAAKRKLTHRLDVSVLPSTVSSQDLTQGTTSKIRGNGA